MVEAPSLDAIRSNLERLSGRILETPVRRWEDRGIEEAAGAGTTVLLKEELYQRTGSFKPRGALTVMMDLEPAVLRRGVTAVSAGNHAMAVAYAARVLDTTAKVVMPRTANRFRVEGSRAYGAEVELVEDVHRAFERVKEIEEREGRTFVHPFEGPKTALGTATLGYEFFHQAQGLDAIVVPVGGGGLLAGVSAAVKQLSPKTLVFGVEPTGADSLTRSFRAGSPQSIPEVKTIADSLGAPHAAPYSFALCRRFVDEIVLVEDDLLRSAMRLLFHSAKLAVEPAGAAATAALIGPLRERLASQRVGLIVCGANIDVQTFSKLLS